MIKTISDISKYVEYLDDMIDDKFLSSPFCDREKIIRVSKDDNNLLLGCFDKDELIGLFCLLVVDEEKYIESMFLYTKYKYAYEELLDYLTGRYQGYETWFIYNPNNDILNSYLMELNAFFYTAQKCMEYKGNNKEDVKEIIEYSDEYKDEYINIHNKDGYWDGEKVLKKIDNFYVCLCIRDNKLVGYIELTKGKATNEIMDIWILPEYRNQGIGALLLKKAIYLNGDNKLILTVDIDNDVANHLYKKMGFEEIEKNNAITARVMLK